VRRVGAHAGDPDELRELVEPRLVHGGRVYASRGPGYVFALAIRRATDADAEALRELWEAFTAEASYTPYPAHPFTPGLLTDNTVLVADDDGAIAGTLYLSTANAGFGFVFGVYVVPEARRRGVAEALVRAAALILRDEGRSYLVLGVDTPNEAARGLYAKLGFVDQARTLRADVDRLL
jgi:ribosomal protein S18 acetylase RimI-like enzyme